MLLLKAHCFTLVCNMSDMKATYWLIFWNKVVRTSILILVISHVSLYILSFQDIIHLVFTHKKNKDVETFEPKAVSTKSHLLNGAHWAIAFFFNSLSSNTS